MRVWLVENRSGPPSLEGLLRQLEEKTNLRLLGAAPFQADFAKAMRKLVPELLDLLVVNERAWPETSALQEVLELGIGIVIATETAGAERFRSLAEQYPISFLPSEPNAETLWLTLVSAWSAQRREVQWRQQLIHLQQRLDDRIVIERAKGVLVQRLKISEEEAYKRLRVLSRRQRRQIREIAQSLLDTQCLFSQEGNGFAKTESPLAEALENEPES